MNKEFRDWLEEKKRVSAYSYLNNGKLIIPNPDIENELEIVIKKYDELHKPAVIPQYVAEWIIRHRDIFDLYPALRRLESNSLTWNQIYKWYRENTHEFVNAYLTGEYEVEVLSQEENINIVLNDLKEYIKEQQSLSQNVGLAHTSAGNDTHYRQYDFVLECIDEYEPSDELQKLLVPKQEELESKIKVLIEAYKQEDGAYSNPENGWISGFIEDLENLVEEEPLYYALIKGHELIDTGKVYWDYDKSNDIVLINELYSLPDSFLPEMSKSEWNEHGINDTNADFVRVDEELN